MTEKLLNFSNLKLCRENGCFFMCGRYSPKSRKKGVTTKESCRRPVRHTNVAQHVFLISRTNARGVVTALDTYQLLSSDSKNQNKTKPST